MTDSPLTPPAPRATKFRQAAYFYLHVAVLYEAVAYAMLRAGRLPDTRVGPAWLWLVVGAAVTGVVFVALLRWRNVRFARVIWAAHALRLPPLIHGAFLAGGAAPYPSEFYVIALLVAMLNLWMLARAAWDV